MLAGDILSSAAISATAVLANPSRRNSASAVSMIRARVSSGLSLTWGFIGGVPACGVNADDFHNSSYLACQGPRVRDAPGYDPGNAVLGRIDRCEKLSKEAASNLQAGLFLRRARRAIGND